MNWYNVDLGWAYGDLLVSIHRRTNSIDRAYDVLHDALVRLAMASSRGTIQQPHAYLRTVVRTVLANHGRDQARWLPFPTNDDGAGGPEHTDVTAARRQIANTLDAEALAPSPEHLADLRQRLRALQRVMDCLPARCREVFWLFHVEGHTQPAIATRLKISLNMVERHVMRAYVDIWAARECLM